MKLRPYQEKLTTDIFDAFDQGARAVLAVLPTGGGKTVTFAALTGMQSLPVCVQVHRVELVSQISMTLASFGIRHRLVAPSGTVRSIRAEHFAAFGRHFDHPSAPVAVASVDTLISRYDDYRSWALTVGLVITDEAAHVQRDNKWGACLALFPNARSIGFTATPVRADGKGLGAHNDGVYETMVRGPTTADLIAMGYLSNYRLIAKPSNLDVADIKVTASGDFSGKELRTRSHKSHIVGDVVKEYMRHAAGKQGITFTVDVETANELAEQFRAAGVPAAAVSAKTDEGERQRAIKAFRRGELKQLTNCDLFGEGFDVPGVEVVSLARPTCSLGLYLQQVGRALRPAEGKPHALIIDHVGNWERHGLPDSPREWSLEGRAKGSRKSNMPDDVEPVTTCTECFLVFKRVLLPKCPYCGHVRDPESRRKPEQVDGDLMEIDADVLAQLRQATNLPPPEVIAEKVTHAAGRNAGRAAYKNQEAKIRAQKELKDAIALWAGIRKERGQSDSQSFREFFLTFGYDVLTAQTLQRSEMEALTERISSTWAKS